MKIGVPKEIKASEYRVALTPAGVTMLTAAGHAVFVETGAGEGSGFEDRDYEREGAVIKATASEVWGQADMIMKVKEPLASEFGYFREGLLLFTYLHLAAAPDLTQALVDKQVTAIAYETIQLANGSLPLLTPMSEVAGRMAVQVGSQFLEAFNGGRGVLLGGVPGVPPADVVIVGGGVVGTNAAKIAIGMGANVVILEKSADRMRYLDDIFGGRIKTVMSSPYHIAEAVSRADLLVGAVLIPGAKAPHLVTEQMVQGMKKGAVIVDVAVDQGGSIATVDRPTTHTDPIYIKHGVIHYAVANIPGAVPRTSTFALTNATISYALDLANRGWEAVKGSLPLQKGVNTHAGAVTHEQVAASTGISYTPLERWLDAIAYDRLET
ncbi:alanine dehydrogenase [Paenibacillus radicis (ex Gao et al. 2016)]|uniref:Alanine dehydrogenase n=1 Tax=Paenibacillus radicis (ex Gao et al. 2016) TaxID=1737354 RepID=A0A917GUU9_9BACL|nr:alanine dehydrogenase [Paenibacillus radicis (ex Gao et al. 2016)]GGG57104.1 alanine dehydrogenase [Paenibacillus radicis (ex Gao et al. 2016)]